MKRKFVSVLGALAIVAVTALLSVGPGAVAGEAQRGGVTARDSRRDCDEEFGPFHRRCDAEEEERRLREEGWRTRIKKDRRGKFWVCAWMPKR